jgi:HSP20 family molecular chaperone IbpA
MSKKPKNTAPETFEQVSLCENGQSYQLTMALPEMDKSRVKIVLEDNYLVVKSTDEINTREGEASLKSTHIFQKYELPENADTSKIKAQMNNGILSVCVTKRK